MFDDFSPFVVALTTAIAAGAILTMITEALAETHNWTGLIAAPGVFGFICTTNTRRLGNLIPANGRTTKINVYH